VTARVIKSVALAGDLSEEARLALLAAKFNGSRWMLLSPSNEAIDELRSKKLARDLRGEAEVTISGMNVRAVVIRSNYRRGAAFE
jgi:hypothetical protein